jgi:hypothetical protein
METLKKYWEKALTWVDENPKTALIILVAFVAYIILK